MAKESNAFSKSIGKRNPGILDGSVIKNKSYQFRIFSAINLPDIKPV